MFDDVVIAGAGPAGSIAALLLARAGVRVRLIDRARFPRPKLCGDTLNPGALRILESLGIGAEIRRRALPVTGMTVTGPGGTRVTGNYPAGIRGAALTRADLDLLLITAATSAGARLDERVRVRGPLLVDNERVTGVRIAWSGGDESIAARVVVAADGRASRVAGALGLSRLARLPRRWAFGAYFTGVAGQTTHGEMHVRPGGYVGVAPLPGGLTNVCVVRDLDHSGRDSLMDDGVATADGTRSVAIITDAIAADPMLRDRFAGAERASPVSVLGPLAVDATGAGCPGLLMAGDAAGFVDPMTGDGLRFAFRGGELAAAAALRELNTRRPQHEWLAAARAREFRGKWRINRALRTLVGSPAGVAVAAAISSRWRGPVAYLVGVAGDVRLAG